MTASSKPSFGFEDLSDIQPAAREPVMREIDQVAERLGFRPEGA
jgi:hypothetical protein